MQGFKLAFLLCVILCNCYGSDILDDEKKEQELFNSNKPVSLHQLDGMKSMHIYPGRMPHVITGTKDAVKIFNWLKSKGIDHYNTTVIEEYDMGSYALLVGSYTAYDKHDMVTDRGTYLKFFHSSNGTVNLRIFMLGSSLTPWPTKTP